MVYISEKHKETLLLVDKLVDEGKNYHEILETLYWDYGYQMRVPYTKSGKISKTKTELVKDNEYTFVDLKKKRNGFCEWETIRLF